MVGGWWPHARRVFSSRSLSLKAIVVPQVNKYIHNYASIEPAVDLVFDNSFKVEMSVEEKTQHVQLLQASIDDEAESEFRILVNGQEIKYITVDPGLFEASEMGFGPTLFSLLPALPKGDWNDGRVSRSPSTGHPHFSYANKVDLPGITRSWHPVSVNYLDCFIGHKLRTNVYEASAPQFDFPIILKFARFPWEIPLLERETASYEWIKDRGIGATFLGHLTEGERIIGFILARISPAEHATSDDFDACLQALSALHDLGIKHGDINKHNFLIHYGRAILIDFDNAFRNASSAELEEERSQLLSQLEDNSGRGGYTIC